MPSKKSKPIRKARPRSSPASKLSRSSPPSVWREERACSEEGLGGIAREFAPRLRPGQRVLLEGPMGAGKTTFSRYLLEALGVEQPPEGSPTFAIAHEYERGEGGSVVHVDLYRIRSEQEIDERGIPDYYWDERKIILSEWTSMWPEFENAVLRSGFNWRVELGFSEQDPERRTVKITQLFSDSRKPGH